MKKLFVLTSMLALTACGGGSGGGNTPAGFVDTVGESNSVITGMRSNSKYQVARYVANKLGEDANSVNLSRGATTRGAFVPSASTGDTNYDIARELVDLAAWLANDSTSESDIISMFNNSNIDKNKIKAALKLLDDMWCFVGGSAEKTAERILQHRANFQVPLAELQQNTEVFDMWDVEFVMAAASGGGGDEGGSKDTLTFELDSTGQIIAINHTALVNNGSGLVPSESESATFTRNDKTNTFDVGQINGEGTIYTGNGIILTYGREVGLKYSDFGQAKYDLIATHSDGTTEAQKSYEPFAGGYKELRKEAPETDMTFTGKAVGSVSNHGFDKNIAGDATLAFSGGVETLNMYFSSTRPTEDDTPWYDVTIVRKQADNPDPVNNSITFATNDSLTQNIPENLRFNDFESDNTRTKTNYLVDGYNGEGYTSGPGAKGKIDIGYYGGRDGNTTEATGVTQYVEHIGGEGNPEIRMNVGFGMTRDNQ